MNNQGKIAFIGLFMLIIISLVMAGGFASAAKKPKPTTTTIMTTTTMPPTTTTTTVINTTTTLVDSCTDSDGFDVFVQGNTYGSLGGVVYNYTDSCMTSEYLYEFVCEGSAVSGANITCATDTTTECIEGACV